MSTPGHGFVGWRRRFGARRSSAPELDAIFDDSDLLMTVVANNSAPLATATAVLAAIEWPLVTR